MLTRLRAREAGAKAEMPSCFQRGRVPSTSASVGTRSMLRTKLGFTSPSVSPGSLRKNGTGPISWTFVAVTCRRSLTCGPISNA